MLSIGMQTIGGKGKAAVKENKRNKARGKMGGNLI
jgi:hypothetical protein